MDASRRDVLRITGLSAASTAFAGCLAVPDPGEGTRNASPNGPTTGNGAEGIQRTDTPPYEISEPECDPPDEERDPLWLCANMAAEPTLPFDQVETSGSVLRDGGLQPDNEGNADGQFYATLVTDSGDLDRVDPEGNPPAVDLIEGTDFDSRAALIVQTGWGSGTTTPPSSGSRRPRTASTPTAVSGCRVFGRTTTRRGRSSRGSNGPTASTRAP